MECEKCGTIMVIDEWNGWVWTCFHCDHIGRRATDEEVKKQEEEFNQIINRTQKDAMEDIEYEKCPVCKGNFRRWLSYDECMKECAYPGSYEDCPNCVDGYVPPVCEKKL